MIQLIVSLFHHTSVAAIRGIFNASVLEKYPPQEGFSQIVGTLRSVPQQYDFGRILSDRTLILDEITGLYERSKVVRELSYLIPVEEFLEFDLSRLEGCLQTFYEDYQSQTDYFRLLNDLTLYLPTFPICFTDKPSHAHIQKYGEVIIELDVTGTEVVKYQDLMTILKLVHNEYYEHNQCQTGTRFWRTQHHGQKIEGTQEYRFASSNSEQIQLRDDQVICVWLPRPRNSRANQAQLIDALQLNTLSIQGNKFGFYDEDELPSLIAKNRFVQDCN